MAPKPADRETGSGGCLKRYERHRREQTHLYKLVDAHYSAFADQTAASTAFTGGGIGYPPKSAAASRSSRSRSTMGPRAIVGAPNFSDQAQRSFGCRDRRDGVTPR
jgi:hypothetical protein